MHESRVDDLVGLVRSGGSAVVTGPAGIGKSHTLRAVALTLRNGGAKVRELRATAAMAAVPFGALLPVLAHHVRGGGPLAITETALALLTALTAERSVLVVDDAHLLDGPSAGVLHQAAAAGVPVAIALRDGEPSPDAIARLVPDVGAVPVAVRRLTVAETGRMLAGVLGGAVDGRLAHVIHGRAAGLPLAVGALARLAAGSGAAERIDGAWRLTGRLPVSSEVGALMHDTTAALDEEALATAELVAIADGLSEGRLRALDAVAPAERCEVGGVLEFDGAGRATLAHPLLRDALLAELPVLRRRAHLSRLLASAGPPAGVLDRVEVAQWSLELGRDVEVAELLDLAAATAAMLPDQAEAFARAAVDAGAGPPALLQLAELLAHQHRAEEAKAVLDDLAAVPMPPDQVVAATLTKAFLLVFAIGEPDAAIAAIADLPEGPAVAAVRASARAYRGDTAGAAAAAAGIADDATLPAEVRAHAALTRVTALLYERDRAAFAAAARAAREPVAAGSTAIPEGPESLALLEALAALMLDVDPVTGTALGQAGRLRALRRGDDGSVAQWDRQLAEAALLAGDPTRHLAELRIAATARGRWMATTGPMVRATFIRSLALSGDVDGAAAELAALRPQAILPLIRPAVLAAEAEVVACRGDLAAAGTMATAAARDGGGVDLWYAALRFGRPVASAFLDATAGLAGPCRQAQRRHAAAIAAQDPAALEAAAAALEAAGLGWFAVEAMAQAVRLAARHDPTDAAPGERLRVLAARYPHLRSPVVAAIGRPVLTAREAQIARAIADGASARAVAATLGIGVRTVETHVAHVYRKLGVTNREDLKTVLSPLR